MKRKQGQGPATALKEEQFRGLMNVNVRVPKEWATYFHADLNAGGGYNEEQGCPGSPVVCYEALRQRDRFRMLLCDKDPSATESLQQLPLAEDGNVSIHTCSNEDILPVFAREIGRLDRRPDMAMGSILIDPNGWDLPYEELVEFFRRHPRIDAIFNGNLNYFRCGTTLQQNGATGWTEKCLPTPEEMMVDFGKRHGVIGERKAHKGNQFIIICFRNYPFSDHKRIGLYDIHSEEGQRMLTLQPKAAA